MHLEILNNGYRPGTRLLFAAIQLFSRRPVPDAAKLVSAEKLAAPLALGAGRVVC
jgi:hypothetical protein